MAKLSPTQIAEIISKVGRHPDVDGAQKEEGRAKLHTEAALISILGGDDHFKVAATKNFLDWVNSIIDSSKYKIFEHLMTNPVSTIDVTECIFNEVLKIFEGQDRFIGYQFVNEQQRTDFENYLKVINDDIFWRTDCMNAIKNGYNSIMIVDLPALEEGDDVDINPDITVQLQARPTPYYYLLPIGKVFWIDIDPTERDIEWIFFEDCEDAKRAYIFDDVAYYVFNRNDQNQWVQVSVIPHNLGYVPAKQFWSINLSSKSLIRKRGLISNSLGNLDKLLFKQVSETHTELYAEYPIMVMYAQKCDYTDPAGNVCEGGKIKALMKSDMAGEGRMRETYVDCPKCQGGLQSLGAGSIVEAPAMAKAGDPDMIDAVKFVTVDINSLKWIADKVSTLENKITYSIIGVTDEINKGVAINKDQVSSQYESRQNILMSVKNQMEDNHKWCHETMAKLRYGKAFVSCTVNYGTKFFIQTAAQLMEEYLKSRDAGIPAYELANQRNQIYATKYRSNPEMQQRVRILSALEPYQDYSISQIKDLMGMGTNMFDKRLLTLKVDFDGYIQRFEREYVDVNTFMQYSDFSEKINVMRELIMEYVDESIASQSEPPPSPIPILLAPSSAPQPSGPPLNN